MSIEQILVSLIVVFASVISIALAVTHRYVRTIYKGVNYLSFGVLSLIIGYIFYTGVFFDNQILIFFVGNGVFIFGTYLVYKGLNMFMEQDVTNNHMALVLGTGGILGFIAFVFDLNQMIRQNIVAILITYVVIEIFITLYKSHGNVNNRFSKPIYFFAGVFILFMLVRFFMINLRLTYNVVPNQNITYNVLANIVGGILFVILGFMLSIIINARAIGDLKSQRQAMEKVYLTDYLTGLPNRLGLENHLTKLTLKDKAFAVLFIDLDEFKKINDSYGHIIGDKVIKAFSKVMISMVDESIYSARYGGDEFIAVYSGYENEVKLKEAIENKIKTMGSKIVLDDNVFDLTLSVGVSMYPKDGKSIQELIRKADSALVNVKNLGKNSTGFYNEIIEKKSLHS